MPSTDISSDTPSGTAAPAPPAPPVAPRKIRSAGIDAGRFVLACLVVVLHACSGKTEPWAVAVTMACRGAVPFFFIVSGYFLRIPDRLSASVVTRPLVRLLPIYIAWMLLYYAVAWVTGVQPLQFGIKALLSGGTAYPLWYLPALGFAMVVVPVGILTMGWRLTALACAALALYALASGPYHDLLGLAGEPKSGGIVAAPMFLFIGCALAKWPVRPSPLAATALASAGFAVQFLEERLIASLLEMSITSHNAVAGTYLYGTGLFLLARSLRPNRIIGSLAEIGLCSLGIYTSHLLFLWAFHAIGNETPLAVLLLSSLSILCATLLTLLLLRIPRLRILVT